MGIAEQVMRTNDLRTKELNVPEWGFSIADKKPFVIRELTGEERDALTDLYIKAQVPDRANPGQMRQMLPPMYKERLILMAAVNGNGERVFAEKHLPDLAKKAARVIDFISEEITKISGMAGISIKEAEEVFEEVPNDDSGSDFPTL